MNRWVVWLLDREPHPFIPHDMPGWRAQGKCGFARGNGLDASVEYACDRPEADHPTQEEIDRNGK